MSTFQIALMIWLGGMLASLRPVGSWWLGRREVLFTSLQCHGETNRHAYSYHEKKFRSSDGDRPYECERYHLKRCWRGHLSAATRNRSMADGWIITGMAAGWPVMLLPMLALRVTPLTEPELEARRDTLQAEIDRLEKETRRKSE